MFLKKIGFASDDERTIRDQYGLDEDEDPTKILKCHGLHSEFPLGVLGLKYIYYGTDVRKDGRFSIDVTPFEKKHIRQWKEWDEIRDKGWENWLELLYQFSKKGV